MTFKSALWYPIAVVLIGLNLAAGGFAAGSDEPAHAAGHAVLALAFGAWAGRLRRRPRQVDQQPQLQELEAELSILRGELSEAQDRMDFVERLLARDPESHRVERQS